jgi:hypothetical protein
MAPGSFDVFGFRTRYMATNLHQILHREPHCLRYYLIFRGTIVFLRGGDERHIYSEISFSEINAPSGM